MARADARTDFAEDLFSIDSFAADLEDRAAEIVNRLKTHSYQPQPLISVEVPKGTLAIRPGKVLSVCDRTVLSAVVCLVAPGLDGLLGPDVYSWRVKDPMPNKGGIFKESSILDMPFLKSKTIKAELDPFDPWYANWPEFDRESRKAFEDDNYRYLATSDIAAYFENIQLPILRDHLLNLLPGEPKIVNLIIEFLNFWAQRTDTGRVYSRGIPQGNSISSFLGNIFLMPLDAAFADLSNRLDIRYQRYMDDVRVFAKSASDARYSIFLMDKVLRQLHLNVQSAKTKIYDESRKEITKTFVDQRVDDLTELISHVSDVYEGAPLPPSEIAKYERRLKRIGKSRPMGREPIIGARKALSGLSMRAFQRWIGAHNLIGSSNYVSRLLREIEVNPDSRLMQRLVKAARKFPKNSSINSRLMAFIGSENNIFEHQEAESIRAIRYLSRISDQTIKHCKSKVTARAENSYLRVQCAYLLSRTLLASTELTVFRNAFRAEVDPNVQAALCGLLAQQENNNSEIVTMITYHPNERVRDLGKLFHRVKNDADFAKARLDYMFGNAADWVLCDSVPILHLQSFSDDDKIRSHLKSALEVRQKTTSIVGLRSVLSEIYSRVRDA